VRWPSFARISMAVVSPEQAFHDDLAAHTFHRASERQWRRAGIETNSGAMPGQAKKRYVRDRPNGTKFGGSGSSTVPPTGKFTGQKVNVPLGISTGLRGIVTTPEAVLRTCTDSAPQGMGLFDRCSEKRSHSANRSAPPRGGCGIGLGVASAPGISTMEPARAEIVQER